MKDLSFLMRPGDARSVGDLLLVVRRESSAAVEQAVWDGVGHHVFFLAATFAGAAAFTQPPKGSP